MNTTKETLKMKLDQIAGALVDADENPTIGQDTSVLEAQADLYRAMIEMCDAIDKLAAGINAIALIQHNNQ